MRNSETHFQQVPIEMVESIIQQDPALQRKPKKSPVLAPAPEQQAVRKFPEPQRKIPSKGQP